MRPLFALFLTLLVSASAAAQSSSEAEIQEAIRLGLARKADTLRANCNANPGRGAIFSANMAGGEAPTGVYGVWISTNLTWIAKAAEEAAQKYLPFTRAEVSDKLLQPVVYVRVIPTSTMNTMHISVHPKLIHVVLKSKVRENVVVQPANMEVIQMTVGPDGSTEFGPGGTLIVHPGQGPDREVPGASLAFDINLVRRLPSGDFDVVLVTDAGERKCKIDKGARKRLGI